MTDIDTDLIIDDAITTADRQTHPTLPRLVLERHATLDDLRVLLESQQAVKVDTVVSAGRLRYEDGTLIIADGIPATEAQITNDGVTPAREAQDLALSPTALFEDQLAGALEIPRRYVRKMRTAANNEADDELGISVALLDRNVNHWLLDNPNRLFTVRAFYNDQTGDGIARSVMSGRYALLDHMDQLMAVLSGLRQVSETNPDVSPETLKWKVDLTERNMRVRVIAPQINMLAPEILGDYRDPWGGRYSGSTGDTPPVLEAGLDFRNSENGAGAWMIVPFVHVLVCTNGMTMTKHAMRKTHIGGEQAEGRIQFSVETHRKRLDVVTAETADAVSQYLSTAWLAAAVDELREAAGVKVDDAKGTIEHVAKVHKFSDAERDSIFELFLRGGQETAGGVAQAITAHAHIAAPTRAMELDDVAVAAMQTAAKFAAV